MIISESTCQYSNYDLNIILVQIFSKAIVFFKFFEYGFFAW